LEKARKFYKKMPFTGVANSGMKTFSCTFRVKQNCFLSEGVASKARKYTTEDIEWIH
jgi:hypothetical protein